jgi:hypothetical protein
MHNSNRSFRKAGTLLALVALLLAAEVYVTHSVFTSRFPGANDFYSRWKGAEVYWREGLNPYSEQASLAIQQGIYGRPAGPGEDPGPFAYPFYTVFLLLPLVWLPYAWVQAVWLVIVQLSLVIGVGLCLSLLDWRLPPWLLACTMLWSIFFYHSARTIFLGQFAGLVFLWTMGTLWALKTRHDVAAGVLLSLTTVKPQMSFLLIPALLLWGLTQRRWRFVTAFGLAMALLVGLSFLLQPNWLADFARQLAAYPTYTTTGSPVWIVAHYYLPFLDTPGEVLLSLLLLLYVFYQWRHLLHAGCAPSSFYWVIGMTLVVTNLVALRTATTNYVQLYFPLFLVLQLATARLPARNLVLALFYLLSAVGTWLLFLVTVVDKFEHPIVYLPLPVGLFAALVWAKAALQAGSRVREQSQP